jgi:hypothetical protein
MSAVHKAWRLAASAADAAGLAPRTKPLTAAFSDPDEVPEAVFVRTVRLALVAFAVLLVGNSVNSLLGCVFAFARQRVVIRESIRDLAAKKLAVKAAAEAEAKARAPRRAGPRIARRYAPLVRHSRLTRPLGAGAARRPAGGAAAAAGGGARRSAAHRPTPHAAQAERLVRRRGAFRRLGARRRRQRRPGAHARAAAAHLGAAPGAVARVSGTQRRLAAHRVWL